MSEKQKLSDYLKTHKNKIEIEQSLIKGTLTAFGIAFDPDIHTEDSGQITHYIKDGKKIEIPPVYEQIPTIDWEIGTVDWLNSSLKIQAESQQHTHLKWWSDIYVTSFFSKGDFEFSKSRKHGHIIMFEKACMTLLEKNKIFPTAREVWTFLEKAIDNEEEYYDERIQEITKDTIFYKAQNDSEKSTSFKSFENQISKIRKKYKTHS